MKIGVRAALVVGVTVVIVLVARQGASAVMGLLSGAGWKLLWLVPLQALPLLLDASGWRPLITTQVKLRTLFLIASIRQAINRLLPVANVGGEIVGVRLLTLRGVEGTAATASVIVEVMLTLIAQYFFVAVGVVCLVARADSARILPGLEIGLAVSLPPLIIMIFLLREGQLFRRIEQLARRAFSTWWEGADTADQGARLDGSIRALFAARAPIVKSVAWQFAGLIAGCSETWFALRWLGHPVGFSTAVVLESLTQAAKSALFFVPAGLGVQEAGLIGVGHVFGLGADVALALSLAKRMREIVFGVPALLAWQWIEGWRMFVDSRRGGSP